MKLGLLTSAFPTLSLDEVADWAAANGFQTLEVAVWPSVGGTARRYAGTAHIEVETLDQAGADGIVAGLAERGLTISALAYYPNPLDPDPDVSEPAIAHLKSVIVAAELLGVEIVGTFVGRDKNKTVAANLLTFAEVWPPIVRFAAEHGRKIAIENCPMIFSDDEWPGGTNLAYAPSTWRRMFEIIPDANFGLNLDPSHHVWQFIDTARAIREFGDRIFHVHAKDLMIDRDGLYENGIMSLGEGWQIPKLCGLGEVNWNAFFSALYSVGYNGVTSIEHEDRAFEGSVDAVKRGFLIARDNLAPFIH